MTTETQQQDAAYQRWLDNLDSLEAFRLATRSAMSRYGHCAGFRITDERNAKLLTTMGSLATRYRALVDVAYAVVKATNPYSSVKEWEAKLYEAAAAVLKHGYYDVDLHTGPEPCRRSDAERPYTRAEKLATLEALRSLCDNYIGPGWCAQQLAAELHIRL
jgi:hypothetical protein